MSEDKLRAALEAAAEEAHTFGPDHDRLPIFDCTYEPCRQRRAALAASATDEEPCHCWPDQLALSGHDVKCPKFARPAAPVALDVEALTVALQNTAYVRAVAADQVGPNPGYDAEVIAREYAALSGEPTDA